MGEISYLILFKRLKIDYKIQNRNQEICLDRFKKINLEVKRITNLKLKKKKRKTYLYTIWKE